MQIVSIPKYRGHLIQIESNTFSIIHDRIMPLVTDVIAFVSTVPAERFLLLRLAGSMYVNGEIPILAENTSFWWASNCG